jgi:hypothetical protein
MKKFKILMFSIFIMISVSESFAQTFAIKTGVNLSKMLLKDEFETVSKDYKLTPRFQLGVTVEFPITKLYSFESGLFFSSKGYKHSSNSLIMQNDINFDLYENQILNYIEIPLTAKVNTLIGRLPIYGTFGPYIGIGLNGKLSIDEFSDNKTERKVYTDTMGPDRTWKRFDYGLQAGAGIVIHQFLVGINYDFGILKVNQLDGYKCKNRVLGLTLGYKL